MGFRIANPTVIFTGLKQFDLRPAENKYDRPDARSGTPKLRGEMQFTKKGLLR